MKKCLSKNPVNTTIDVIGGKWKALIMWYLFQGTLRFNELKKELPGVTQKMITQQLRELEADGLINRKVYPVIPPKVEYSVTEYAETIKPVLKEMAKWGEKHKELHKEDLTS